MKPLLIRAIAQEKLERPPVWMMRQAGRYMQEYRLLKEKYSFLELCKSEELAFEVSMQPMRFLDPDAAIVFADILLPAESLGIEIDFNPGPKIINPIKTPSDIRALSLEDPWKKQSAVFKTIKKLRETLDGEKAVLGFAGAPWTMSCYLIDQGIIKHFQNTQCFAAENPGAFFELQDKLVEQTICYLLAQIESGADALQIFDTWAGNLSLDDYKTFALPATQKIIAEIKRQKNTPVILYVNGSSHLISEMCNAGADCLSVDWRTPLSEIEKLIPKHISLQGNLDSTALFLKTEEIVRKTSEMLSSLQRKTGYIANLGHGILPTTPRENAKAFVDTVKNFNY